MLAATDRRPDALTAFRLARRWLLAGRKIEMGELATELGVNRATLFRWVGSRDALLGEIYWSLAEPAFTQAVATVEEEGAARVAAVLAGFAAVVDEADYFREFLRREPERALRILTTRAGSLQSRLVAAVESLLREEIDADRLDPPLPPHDLAYLIVRISESFIYADVITGEHPDTGKVAQAVAALLGARQP